MKKTYTVTFTHYGFVQVEAESELDGPSQTPNELKIEIIKRGIICGSIDSSESRPIEIGPTLIDLTLFETELTPPACDRCKAIKAVACLIWFGIMSDGTSRSSR